MNRFTRWWHDGQSTLVESDYRTTGRDLTFIARRDWHEAWINTNVVLLRGEAAVDKGMFSLILTDPDPYQVKIGDGVTRWVDLPYVDLDTFLRAFANDGLVFRG